MAWRTSQSEVRAIISTDPDLSVDPFIDTANALTDYVVSQDSGSVLTDALTKKIEENLAAHFYAHRDLQYHSKRTDGASAVFQGKTDMGLDSTLWGQTAKRLDVTGTLTQLDSTPRPKASGVWLGRPPSEQTDYKDRD